MKNILEKIANTLCSLTLDFFNPDNEKDKLKREKIFINKIYPDLQVLKKLSECSLTKDEIKILVDQLRLSMQTSPQAIEVFESIGCPEISIIELKNRLNILSNILDKMEKILTLVEVEELTSEIYN